MMDFKKTFELTNLFNTYKSLLTEKQIKYFELSFEEDLSLQEIADEFKISKAAVYDSINKTIVILNDLESKLHLNQIQNSLNKIVKENEQTKNQEVEAVIKKIKELL